MADLFAAYDPPASTEVPDTAPLADTVALRFVAISAVFSGVGD